MKLVILFAAAALAVPAVAQNTAGAMGQPSAGAPDAAAAEQAGGYQPATPPMASPAQPGATVTFQPSVSPEQAFPPPAPLDHYPICKRGQTDKCMQRGGR